MRMWTNGLVVSKKFNKAKAETEFNGRKFPARAKSYSLFFVIGDMEDPEKMLMDGTPQLINVKVSREDYLDATTLKRYDVRAEEERGNYQLLQIKGMDIISAETLILAKSEDGTDDEGDEE